MFGERKQYKPKHRDLKQPSVVREHSAVSLALCWVAVGEGTEGRLEARPRPQNENIPVSECFQGDTI